MNESVETVCSNIFWELRYRNKMHFKHENKTPRQNESFYEERNNPEGPTDLEYAVAISQR